MSARLAGIKQGVSFSFYADYALGGVAEVFAASDLTCQVRSKTGEKLSQISVVASATPGRYVFAATATQTATWPVADVFFDIKRVSGGVTTYTETVVMAVDRRQTA